MVVGAWVIALAALAPPARRELPPLQTCKTIVNRRAMLFAAPSAAAALALAPPSAALAKETTPTADELLRLAKGEARIQYLLDNWEELTTVCIKGCVGKPEQCGCVRDPTVVQGYLGFKSMNDPLFRADQLMIRAEPLVKSEDLLDDYSNAIDRWTQKVEMSNVMAYTSSWGEANPGGGKSEVERYLSKSRKEVEETSEILRGIMSMLDVPRLPASTGDDSKGGGKIARRVGA